MLENGSEKYNLNVQLWFFKNIRTLSMKISVTVERSFINFNLSRLWWCLENKKIHGIIKAAI